MVQRMRWAAKERPQRKTKTKENETREGISIKPPPPNSNQSINQSPSPSHFVIGWKFCLQPLCRLHESGSEFRSQKWSGTNGNGRNGSGSKSRINSKFRIQNKFKIQSSEFRIQNSKFRIQNSEFSPNMMNGRKHCGKTMNFVCSWCIKHLPIPMNVVFSTLQILQRGLSCFGGQFQSLRQARGQSHTQWRHTHKQQQQRTRQEKTR